METFTTLGEEKRCLEKSCARNIILILFILLERTSFLPFNSFGHNKALWDRMKT